MARKEQPLLRRLLRRLHEQKTAAYKAILDAIQRNGFTNLVDGFNFLAQNPQSLHCPASLPVARQQPAFVAYHQPHLGQTMASPEAMTAIAAPGGEDTQIDQEAIATPEIKSEIIMVGIAMPDGQNLPTVFHPNLDDQGTPTPADDSIYPLGPLLDNDGAETRMATPYKMVEFMPRTPGSDSSHATIGGNNMSPSFIDPQLNMTPPLMTNSRITLVAEDQAVACSSSFQSAVGKSAAIDMPSASTSITELAAQSSGSHVCNSDKSVHRAESHDSPMQTSHTGPGDDQTTAMDCEVTAPDLDVKPRHTSRPLGAVDPYAAGLFVAEFDKAVGLPQQPKPAACSMPEKKELRSLYKVAHDRALSPFNPVNFVKWQDRFESRESFYAFMIDKITQMMYVSGETGEPSAETTGIIEDIVRQQVIEILRCCTELAIRRGSRTITINDLIFQIRDDAPKVSRLRTFLSWKDVRKNVKDSDEKGADADIGAGEDPVGGVVPGGPVDDTTKKNKKAKVGLPWEPSSFYSQEVPEREDEDDEEEEEMNYITLQRLRKADERTKAMTREEYVTWSEFRQASFTYRKGKRFREWAGFGVVTDSKPSDDIVDILGFLTFEMVQTLTEEALKIKEHEDMLREPTGGINGENGKDGANVKKRKLGGQGLFDPPSEGRTPVESRHIQEAFRRLQQRSKKGRAMLMGTRLPQRTNLRLI